MSIRSLIACLLAALLAGCSAQKSHAPASAESQTQRSSQAVIAAAPQAIDLTDQKRVWECPTCGIDYDAAGKCPMDGAELKAMDVSYICPADNKPVEHTGKCPRCAANARVDKVAAVDASSSVR